MDAQSIRLNPWLSIWTKPRQTIQQIVDTNPNNSVLFLAAMNGMVQILASFTILPYAVSWSIGEILLFSIVVGCFVGIILINLQSKVMLLTGGIFAGQASFREIRAAVSWAAVPNLWCVLFWIPRYMLLGEQAFHPLTPENIPSSDHVLMGLNILSLLQFTLSIWTLIILSKCIAQVQKISAIQGFLNFLMSSFLIVLGLGIVAEVVVRII